MESGQLRSELSEAKAELARVQGEREDLEGKLQQSVANREAEIQALNCKLSDSQDRELKLRQVISFLICYPNPEVSNWPQLHFSIDSLALDYLEAFNHTIHLHFSHCSLTLTNERLRYPN